MKKKFTYQKWICIFVLLFSALLNLTAEAQRSAAKCAGFTARITNGSVLNLCTGSTITLNADPDISGYDYQWQVQTTAGGPFTSIAGATRSSYTVSNLGAYRVYVSTGTCVDTSGITAVVRITPDGGNIVAVETNTICPGEIGGLIKGTRVAGADVGIINYTWERSENNTTWATIPDASNYDYTVGNLYKTTWFRRVSNDNCGNKAFSNVVTLAIAPAILPGTIEPATQTITSGSTPAPITSTTPATGGSGNFIYQWQSSEYERGVFSDIPGATSKDFPPGPLNHTTYYKRIAIDARCFNKAESPIVVVYVTNGVLKAGSFTTNSSCFFKGYPSTGITFTTANPPSGGVPPYTIEWQSSTDAVNFTTIAGATENTYQPIGLTQTSYFRKKVVDASGTTAYTEIVTITMIETPLMPGTIQATSNVACLGSSPAEISSLTSASGFGETVSYQWQYMNASSGGWKDIPGQIRGDYLPDPIAEKTTFRRLVIDRCGNNNRSAASNEVVIDVKPALIAGDIEPTSQMIRPGATPVPLRSVANPSGGTGSYTVSWEQSDLAVGPWDTIPSQHSVSYQPAALTKSTYYRRVVKDNNCLATKYTYVVEVYLNQAPPIDPCHLGGSNCVFPGNRPGVIDGGDTKVSGGVPPYTFSWETKSITAGTWTVIAGASAESYHPEVITQTTQYRRKVTDAVGDFAYSDPFTIDYHTAALQPGTIVIKAPSVVCSGATPGLIESVTPVTGYGENPRYQWQVKKEGENWTDINGANEESYQPGNITSRTHFRRAVTDMCGGVTRTAYSNEVIFDLAPAIPIKAGLVDGPFITCSGTAPGTIKSVLEACGGGSTLRYQWEVLQNGVWQTISGATSASYTPGAITENTIYRRKVSDDCGNVGYSNEVKIYVYPPIESGVIGTETQTVCANQQPEKLRLLTNCHYTDGTVTYQWQSAPASNGPWSEIAGANSAEYQPTGATENRYFRLVVKSTTCNAIAYTNSVSVLISANCAGGNGATVAAGANGTAGENEIKVYPNPIIGSSFNVEAQTSGKVSVQIFNAEGKPIPVTVKQSSNKLMNINFLSSYARGMYVLIITDEYSTRTKKVIVQ